ncbi:MAG: hypothetical protein M1827_005333 [Pycnora praestabilis]|nr:MAG: hypothetical protein M1827_005333 [Pycnora praestabilis]
MGDDEGEKFFMEYWQFDEFGTKDKQSLHVVRQGSDEGVVVRRKISTERLQRRSEEEVLEGYANSSITYSFMPPFSLHTNEQMSFNSKWRRFRGDHIWPLQKRAFECPTGTSNCSAIGRPNSCCAQSETCQLITDTGLGDVGCCGQGLTCSGQVTACETGTISCPNNPGGGCCITNYSCVDVGCVLNSTVTAVVIATPSTLTTTSITPLTTTTASTIPSSTTSAPPTTSTAAAAVAATIPCSSGYQTCAASLGGGCCPTDRACGSMECPALPGATSSTSASNTTDANPAVRPTSGADTVTTTTSAAMSTITGTACPTGFYACSAYYQGGCCRVGRDCAPTSCPTFASDTIITSDGVTVVAPSGAAGASVNMASSEPAPSSGTISATSAAAGIATTSASVVKGEHCAAGWFSCAGSANGGCCPTGYTCGTATCSATVTGAGNVGKIAPTENEAKRIEALAACLVSLGVMAFAGMIVL